MDLLRRSVAWLVRFGVDRAAFADRMDRRLGISNAGRGLDCNDRAGGAIHLARRCDAAPPVDDSQLRTDGGSHYFADVPAACFRVSLAVFDCVSCDRVAVLDSG